MALETRRSSWIRIVAKRAAPILKTHGRQTATRAGWTRLATAGSAPIVFSNRVMGTVHVEMSRWPALVATGAGLATLVYSCPVALAVKMEGRIDERIVTEAESRATALKAKNAT